MEFARGKLNLTNAESFERNDTDALLCLKPNTMSLGGLKIGFNDCYRLSGTWCRYRDAFRCAAGSSRCVTILQAVSLFDALGIILSAIFMISCLLFLCMIILREA